MYTSYKPHSVLQHVMCALSSSFVSHLLTFPAHHVTWLLILSLLVTCFRHVHYSSPAAVTLCVY